MKVLHWDFSPRYERFLQALPPWLDGTDIRYLYSQQHSDVRLRQYRGSIQIHEAGMTVYLNAEDSLGLAEETAAHQLCHAALLAEGFGYAAVRKPHPQETWSSVAASLTNALRNILADRRVALHGYDGAEFRDRLFCDTLGSLKREPKPDRDALTILSHNALGFFGCYHTLDPARLGQLIDAWIHADSLSYEVGLWLVHRAAESGFDTPEQHNALLGKFLEVLQVEPYIIIVDPTGSCLDEPNKAASQRGRVDRELLQVVCEDLSAIHATCPKDRIPSDVEIRWVSSALRRLLLEGTLQRAWRMCGFAKQPFVLTAIPQDPRVLRSYLDDPSVTMYLEAPVTGPWMGHGYTAIYNRVLGDAEASESDERWSRAWHEHKPLPLKAYLDTECFKVQGMVMTRRDVIKYVAHKLGGVHYDLGGRIPQVEQIRDTFSILDREPMLIQVLAIARCLVRSADVRCLTKRAFELVF